MKLVKDDGDPQLTLEVDLHPEIAEIPDPFIVGTLKIKGDLHCPHDVQAGDALTVQVADADGNVIASAKLVGEYPSFRDLVEKNIVIGAERQNKAHIE